MTPRSRELAVKALRIYHDSLIGDVQLRRHDEYLKGDWRGDLHRRKVAREIRQTRNAIRELEPRAWPQWYADQPLAAYQREGR